MDQYLTIEEAAKILGVEYKTVYRLVRDGSIPAGRIGRVYRIKQSELDEFFQRSKSAETRGKGGGGRPIVPLMGLRCCVTGKRIVSELDVGGYAHDTGEPICMAAWEAGARRSVKPDPPEGVPPSGGG